MAITTKTLTIDLSQAGRVDRLIHDQLQFSRSQIRGLVDHQCVRINGTVCSTVSTLVQPGDLVLVSYDPHHRYHESKRRWDDRTFAILYEDDDLIVVDKAAGVLTVPSDWNEKNTLLDRVTHYLSHSRRKKTACLVHRLDREVSGVLVFGKHEPAAEALIAQFKEHKPERVYVAIVAGELASDTGTFTGHLATGKNLDRYVTRPGRKAEAAITHYRVLRRMADTTFVEVRLETGKRNQIRVHFADAGHPVLGDPRYGKAAAKHPRWIRQRIALHAQSLAFEHPQDGRPMSFESPLPAAIQKFLAGSK